MGSSSSSGSRSMAPASSWQPVKDRAMVAAKDRAMVAANSAKRTDHDDDQDVDAFLAGGRAMAVAATRAQQQARERAAQNKAMTAAGVARERERRMQEQAAERQRQEDERKKKEEERRRLQEEMDRIEEERLREQRRKARAEEKKRRKEEKARKREQERRELGLPEEEEEDVDEGDSSEEEERRKERRPKPGGVFKEAFRGDDAKRQHWDASVKGRVSHDNKGFSDADLDRRFGFQQQTNNAGEKLMTEAEVLAMLKKGKAPK